MIKLPGFIDIHVHMRQPGAEHKEDWASGTQSAVAGGVTLILAMPNTNPPLTDAQSYQNVDRLASSSAFCDFGLFIGATAENYSVTTTLAEDSAGLKMYLNNTYGPLQLDDMESWINHLTNWHSHKPIAVHAEDHTLAAVILMAEFYKKHIHLCHVSRRDEILLIKEAKQRNVPITCEVTPHHLFLSEEDFDQLPGGRKDVKPPLRSKKDQEALWENIDWIDCIATDHAPHTIEEKDGENPPPGFPGVETMLPLMLTAVSEGRLSLDRLIELCHTNPKMIFHLPDQPDTWIELDETHEWSIKGKELHSKCRWTPFEGKRVKGIVRNVQLRNHKIYEDGVFHETPGWGKNVFSQEYIK